MLGLIKRTCKGLDDLMTLRTLYCSLVRSNLDYCLVVWSPYTKRNIDKLERVQRRVTKLFSKSNHPYDIRLKKLNLMSLEKRLLTDVTFLHEVLNGNLIFRWVKLQISTHTLAAFHFNSYARTNVFSEKKRKNFSEQSIYEVISFKEKHVSLRTRMARGDSDIKRTGVSWKILQRIPKRYQELVLCGRGLSFFSSLRDTNSDMTFSSVIFFGLNILKSTAEAFAVHLLSLNTLKSTIKSTTSTPVIFIWEVPPGKMGHSKRL